MRSESDLLEKFIQHCHSKQEGLSDTYITQIYSNMQELLLVQFLNEELQHQQSKVDELQYKLAAAEERASICLDYKNIYLADRDDLQKQLIDQGQRFNEQAQRVKDLEHKNNELQKQVDAALKLLAENSIDFYEAFESGKNSRIVDADELEQALKVGSDEEQ